MVDGIEEFREVHFHHVAVPFGYVPLGLFDGLMGTPPGAESITEFRKRRVEMLSQHLSDGLLDHSILRRRDAEHSRAPVRFWNGRRA